MPPILDLIAKREAAAAAASELLREQIAKLTAELTAVDTELHELAVTRRTLTRLTDQAGTAAAGDATIAGPAYQQILAALGAATEPMRAKQLCRALDLDTTPKDTEGLRAKLKRLVSRGIAIEPEPGLFALAPATGPS